LKGQKAEVEARKKKALKTTAGNLKGFLFHPALISGTHHGLALEGTPE